MQRFEEKAYLIDVTLVEVFNTQLKTYFHEREIVLFNLSNAQQ